MTTSAIDVKALEAQHVLQTYRRQPVVFERGDGMRLFDDAGRAISTFCRASASRRSATRIPRSRARLPIRRRRCCTRRTCISIRCRASSRARLSALTGLDRAFFCNSGTEAIEACLKFARRYWHTQGAAQPHEVRRVHPLAFTAARWARCR